MMEIADACRTASSLLRKVVCVAVITATHSGSPWCYLINPPVVTPTLASRVMRSVTLLLPDLKPSSCSAHFNCRNVFSAKSFVLTTVESDSAIGGSRSLHLRMRIPFGTRSFLDKAIEGNRSIGCHYAFPKMANSSTLVGAHRRIVENCHRQFHSLGSDNLILLLLRSEEHTPE